MMTKLHFLSKQGSLFAKAHRWLRPLTFVLVIVGLLAINAADNAMPLHAASPSKIIWLQTMDSCRQAIRGASWTLTGNGLTITKGPAPGRGPEKVESGSCPLQRGNCSTITAGCLSWSIPFPASGTVTYQIKETTTPKNYVPCDGGSVCPGGPEVVTLHISSTGAVSATTLNIHPDRTSVTYPRSGAAYTGTTTDPIVTHNFQLGTGSCDDDHDADDQLTGSPSSHCDSDGD